MPISGPNSYAPTMQTFISHWTSVNAQLGVKPLLLPDGFSLANFTTLRTTIITKNDTAYNKLSLLRQASSNLDNQKSMMKDMMEMFRQTVLGELPYTPYAASVPKLPRINEMESRFLNPAVQMAFIWNQINTTPPSGFTPPLMLPDATQIADFNTMLADIRTAYNAVTTARTVYANAVRTRNADFPTAKQWMKEYRNAVFARIAPGDPLRDNVPHYTRTSGPTPKPVTNVLFYYNSATNAVRITYTPSVSANLTAYALRFSPGTKYDPNNEITVATNPPTSPFEFDFTLDQVVTGSTALFKIYAINDTGNERASKLMKIKRTAAMTGTVLQLAA